MCWAPTECLMSLVLWDSCAPKRGPPFWGVLPATCSLPWSWDMGASLELWSEAMSLILLYMELSLQCRQSRPSWGISLETREAENPGGWGHKRVWPSPEPWVSQPVSVCKLPPIVTLPFWSFRCCVPSQLKIRFCLQQGKGPGTLLRKSAKETGHRVDGRGGTSAQFQEAGSVEREMALPLCFYV